MAQNDDDTECHRGPEYDTHLLGIAMVWANDRTRLVSDVVGIASRVLWFGFCGAILCGGVVLLNASGKHGIIYTMECTLVLTSSLRAR